MPTTPKRSPTTPIPPLPADLAALVDAVCDTQYMCGEWSPATSDETYQTVHGRAEAARANLVARLRELVDAQPRPFTSMETVLRVVGAVAQSLDVALTVSAEPFSATYYPEASVADHVAATAAALGATLADAADDATEGGHRA